MNTVVILSLLEFFSVLPPSPSISACIDELRWLSQHHAEHVAGDVDSARGKRFVRQWRAVSNHVERVLLGLEEEDDFPIQLGADHEPTREEARRLLRESLEVGNTSVDEIAEYTGLPTNRIWRWLQREIEHQRVEECYVGPPGTRRKFYRLKKSD